MTFPFRLWALLLLICVALAVGCAKDVAKPKDPKKAAKGWKVSQRHEDLDAILWVQTSGEYNAITRQTYRLAELALKEALADPQWSASMEQRSLVESGEVKLADLPPAVILDVDETVLNNSTYQVGLIGTWSEYTPEGWKTYVKAKESYPIAGAVEFAQTCREAGVQLLFVTNREHEVETPTRENLISAGLMQADDPDILFCKHEKEQWKSDKTSRRLELARQYRLLLLVGDDLHDFASTGNHPTPAKRRELVGSHADWWGSKWIVLPNPNYGGWEQSLHDWNNLSSSSTKLQRKREHLRRDMTAGD